MSPREMMLESLQEYFDSTRMLPVRNTRARTPKCDPFSNYEVDIEGVKCPVRLLASPEVKTPIEDHELTFMAWIEDWRDRGFSTEKVMDNSLPKEFALMIAANGYDPARLLFALANTAHEVKFEVGARRMIAHIPGCNPFGFDGDRVVSTLGGKLPFMFSTAKFLNNDRIVRDAETGSVIRTALASGKEGIKRMFLAYYFGRTQKRSWRELLGDKAKDRFEKRPKLSKDGRVRVFKDIIPFLSLERAYEIALEEPNPYDVLFFTCLDKGLSLTDIEFAFPEWQVMRKKPMKFEYRSELLEVLLDYAVIKEKKKKCAKG